MVGGPAPQAESGFRLAAWLGGILTALMVDFVLPCSLQLRAASPAAAEG